MDEFSAPQKKAWYKTDGGIAFLVTLSVLLVIGLAFAGFVGYYMVQIKKGNADLVLQQLSEDAQFTANPLFQSENTDVPETYDSSLFIREHNPATGSEDPDAPVTIVMFIDFECPFCQRSYPVLKQVIGEYSTAVNVRFKHFPLTSIHPNATRAAIASTCAQEQGVFWEYYDLIFENKLLNNQSLSLYAKTLDLDMPRFDTCMRNETYLPQIEEDFIDGRELGIRGTPTYFLNNKKIEGVIGIEEWRTLIIDELNSTSL